MKWIGKPMPEVDARPKCPNCGTPLRPDVRTAQERVNDPRGGFSYKTVSRQWSGDYQGYGAFCTLRCCEAFANAAYRAGYRNKT